MQDEAGHAAGAAVGGVPPQPGGRAILGNRRIWRWAPLWVAGAVALAGAGLMFSGRAGPAAFAEVRGGQASGQGLVVSATPLGDNEVVICLVDTSRERMAVYVADGRRSRLKLLAVRDVSADWALTDYNNDPPLPKDVRARVEKAAESASPAKNAPERKPEGAP
jgi:hypothetical protein